MQAKPQINAKIVYLIAYYARILHLALNALMALFSIVHLSFVKTLILSRR